MKKKLHAMALLCTAMAFGCLWPTSHSQAQTRWNGSPDKPRLEHVGLEVGLNLHGYYQASSIAGYNWISPSPEVGLYAHYRYNRRLSINPAIVYTHARNNATQTLPSGQEFVFVEQWRTIKVPLQAKYAIGKGFQLIGAINHEFLYDTQVLRAGEIVRDDVNRWTIHGGIGLGWSHAKSGVGAELVASNSALTLSREAPFATPNLGRGTLTATISVPLWKHREFYECHCYTYR